MTKLAIHGSGKLDNELVASLQAEGEILIAVAAKTSEKTCAEGSWKCDSERRLADVVT